MPPYGGNHPRKRPDEPEQSATSKVLVGLVVVGIVAIAGAAIWARQAAGPAPAPQPNLAPVVKDIAPYVDVAPAGDGGWIAALPLDWQAPSDKAGLNDLCTRTFIGLAGHKGQTVMIVQGETTLVECEAPPPKTVPILPTIPAAPAAQ